jgi:predicted DNA-binding protein (MmcQ/YjbR family)
MDFESLKDHLLNKPGATETFPFDSDTLVFKVSGKMFALIGLKNEPLRINLKCIPEKAELLRELYPAITPGYHMNKRHWNTVFLDGSIDDKVFLAMIDESYELVVTGLPKSKRP